MRQKFGIRNFYSVKFLTREIEEKIARMLWLDEFETRGYGGNERRIRGWGDRKLSLQRG